MQAKAPVEKIAMYLNGFHAAKDDPKMQMEAHHYCNQANEDMAQCVLFDGNTAEARMMGWNTSSPRSFTTPSLRTRRPTGIRTTTRFSPASCACPDSRCRGKGSAQRQDEQLREDLAHVDDGYARSPARSASIGPPRLQWSFNHDDEDMPGMVAERDRRMSFDTAAEKKDREDLVSLAKPQGGVDAMAALFPNAKPVPGVTNNGDAATRPVPTFGVKPPIH